MDQNADYHRHWANLLTKLLFLLLVFLGTIRPVQAQNKQQLATECLNFLDNNQTQHAAEVASEIKLWRNLFGTALIADAEECLSRSTGNTWQYFTSKGGFLSGEEALAELAFIKGAEERRSKKEKDLEVLQCQVIILGNSLAELEQRLERVKDQRYLENELATWSVCVSRYEADREAALLEPVCNSLFSTNGLPDSESNFNYVELQEARIALSQAEANLVDYLSANTAEQQNENEIVQECLEVIK